MPFRRARSTFRRTGTTQRGRCGRNGSQQFRIDAITTNKAGAGLQATVRARREAGRRLPNCAAACETHSGAEGWGGGGRPSRLRLHVCAKTWGICASADRRRDRGQQCAPSSPTGQPLAAAAGLASARSRPANQAPFRACERGTQPAKQVPPEQPSVHSEAWQRFGKLCKCWPVAAAFCPTAFASTAQSQPVNLARVPARQPSRTTMYIALPDEIVYIDLYHGEMQRRDPRGPARGSRHAIYLLCAARQTDDIRHAPSLRSTSPAAAGHPAGNRTPPLSFAASPPRRLSSVLPGDSLAAALLVVTLRASYLPTSKSPPHANPPTSTGHNLESPCVPS